MAFGSVFVSFAGGDSGLRFIISNINVYGVMLITLACMLFIHVDGFNDSQCVGFGRSADKS